MNHRSSPFSNWSRFYSSYSLPFYCVLIRCRSTVSGQSLQSSRSEQHPHPPLQLTANRSSAPDIIDVTRIQIGAWRVRRTRLAGNAKANEWILLSITIPRRLMTGNAVVSSEVLLFLWLETGSADTGDA